MTARPLHSRVSLLPHAARIARWLVGAAFVYLGVVKALDPVAFLKQVQAYELVHDPTLLRAIAAWLPWVEIFCGLLLIVGLARRGTALLCLLMLTGFTLAVAHRGLELAQEQQQRLCLVRFDCGCGTGEVAVCNKLVENTVLIALTCLPLWAPCPPRRRPAPTTTEH